MATQRRHLKIGFINPGSLGTNHEELIVAVERHCIDILAMNETWLRPGEEGRAPNISGYSLRHIPRPREVRERGGGVGFYIKHGLPASTLKHPYSPIVEQMWLFVLRDVEKAEKNQAGTRLGSIKHNVKDGGGFVDNAEAVEK
ncbi:unnamed protein product [Leptidea sinapis]|uniref:Endonuclease/exonuclease/phosphatase domain-containing protein n=1 Tax=Leptidea sinapis TaxID=189913 RepID=A0A5E4QCJ2_9NEOP|nr:unnamed protein product [Leptidea sinapis]